MSNKKYFIIEFPKKEMNGGYGDRLVGIISILSLSQIFNRHFLIKWDKEDISSIFTYSNNYYNHTLNSKIKTIIVNSGKQLENFNNKVNKKGILKIFDSDICLFKTNMELVQSIQNSVSGINYFDLLFNNYRNIYKKHIILNDNILDLVYKVIGNRQKIIGIQVRTIYIDTIVNGQHMPDLWLGNKSNRAFITLKNYFIPKLLNIKKHIENNIKNYTIFITADNNYLIQFAKNIFNDVIFSDAEVMHIEWERHGSNEKSKLREREKIKNYDNSSINDFNKNFIDHYILSTICSNLYISTESNFGRTSALINPTDNIYDIECNIVNKKNLVSKRSINGDLLV